jgi:hypothetical protein
MAGSSCNAASSADGSSCPKSLLVASAVWGAGAASGEGAGAAGEGDAAGVAVAGDAVVAGDVAGDGEDGAVGLALGFGFEFRGLSLAARAVEGDASVAKIATAESTIVIKIFFKVWCRLNMIHLRATDRASSYNDCVRKTPATMRSDDARAIRRTRLTEKSARRHAARFESTKGI